MNITEEQTFETVKKVLNKQVNMNRPMSCTRLHNITPDLQCRGFDLGNFNTSWVKELGEKSNEIIKNLGFETSTKFYFDKTGDEDIAGRVFKTYMFEILFQIEGKTVEYTIQSTEY